MRQAQLGLKSSADPQQLASRLQYHPEIVEFYTSEQDFTKEGLLRLEEAIKQVKEQATPHIILHHPMTYQQEFLELVVPQTRFPETYYFLEKSTSDLLQFGFDYDVQVLVHGSYEMRNQQMMTYYKGWEQANEHLFHEVYRYAALGKEHIMFENSISPLFYFGDPIYDKQIFESNVRLAFDVSHSFIKLHGDNEALVQSLRTLKDHIVHYHLVDSMGKTHDSLPLGQGIIDWKSVSKVLNPKASSIYEIDLKDLNQPKEQMDSHQFLKQLIEDIRV